MGIVNDHDPVETSEWLDSLRAVVRPRASSAPLPAGRLRDEARRAGAPARRRRPTATPFRPGSRRSRRATASSSTDPRGDPLERGGDHPAREQGVVRARGAHRELPVLGAHDIGFGHFCTRPRPSMAATSSTWSHVSPGIYARAFVEGRLTEQQLLGFRQEKRQGAFRRIRTRGSCRISGNSHGVDGTRPLTAIYQARFLKYPRGRGRKDREPQGVGVPRRRRVRRAGVARRHFARRPRAPRQPDLRDQLQPAAPRRTRARQRQDHPGIGRRVPRRGERHQSRVGLRLGQLFEKDKDGILLARMEECVDGQPRTSRARTARVCASTSSTVRSSRRWWRICRTSKCGSSTAAATILSRSMRPTRPR